MKFGLNILVGVLFVFHLQAQVETEQLLENLQVEEGISEDDSWMQALHHLSKHAIDLNTADANEIRQLMLLSDLQIESIISYRKLLGNLTSIYELQAVPGLDISMIKKILPYITLGSENSAREELSSRLSRGAHVLLLRVSQSLDKSAEYLDPNEDNRYGGSPQHILFRYKYNYKNLLQYGIVGDKDAGESFLSGAQKMGFDFYSAHLSVKKIGKIESLVLGDYTVNLGQGLIHWQSLAFKKSSGVMAIKRQSPVLKPYNSAGEFSFHRGGGITVTTGRVACTVFGSFRKLSANIDNDSIAIITSFITSGYHRSQKELQTRNNVSQVTGGGNIVWKGVHGSIGLNAVYYQFSLPLNKNSDPHNLFAIRGRSWNNVSINYNYTFRNIHFFGEAAIDKKFSKACINGLLLSVDPQVDFSIIHRAITMRYQSVYGNAFTENTLPSNEHGLYAGITIRFSPALKLDAYADFYKFPWLKLLSDAPSQGSEFLFQFHYNPNKNVEVYLRYRAEKKPANIPGTATNSVLSSRKQNLRNHLSCKINRSLSIRTRAELAWFIKNSPKQEGWLIFTDINFQPVNKPYSAVFRLQFFESDDYDTRMYAYENDVLYSYSLPAFYNNGFRYYLVINYNWQKKIECWIKWSQTIQRDAALYSSNNNESAGSIQSDIRIQVCYSIKK